MVMIVVALGSDVPFSVAGSQITIDVTNDD